MEKHKLFFSTVFFGVMIFTNTLFAQISDVEVISDTLFNQGNIQFIDQALDGLPVGVWLSRAGSEPGKDYDIRVRGISTLIGQSNPLIVVDGLPVVDSHIIDPLNIESVRWIKGGNAAKYGLLGGSGVLEIKTREISEHKLTVAAGSFVAAEQKIYKQQNLNRSAFISRGGQDLGDNTDWVQQITKTGNALVNYLTFTQHIGQFRYNVSINHRNIHGILANTHLEKLNLLGKVGWASKNDKIAVYYLTAINKESNYPGFRETFKMAMTLNPTMSVYNDSGKLNNLMLFDMVNPMAFTKSSREELYDRSIHQVKIDGNLGFLNLHGRLAMTNHSNKLMDKYNEALLFLNDVAYSYNKKDNRLFGEFLGDKNFSLGKVDFNVVGGMSYNSIVQDESWKNIKISTEISDSIQNSTKMFNTYFGVNAKLKWLEFEGFYSKVSSTALGENGQNGLLHSNTISVYPFNKGDKKWDVGFRISEGVTGLTPLDNRLKGAYGGRVANPDLTFEKQQNFESGIFITNNNRWYGSANYYVKKSGNLIGLAEIIPGAYSPSIANDGEIMNMGLEFLLSGDLHISDKRKWFGQLQVTTLKTEWTKLPSEQLHVMNLSLPGTPNSGLFIYDYSLGRPFATFYGPVYFQLDKNGNEVLKDFNNDGKVDAIKDYKMIGKALPSVWFGFVNRFEFSSFTFSFLIKAAFGHSIASITNMQLDHQYVLSGNIINNGDNPAYYQNVWNDQRLESGNYLRMQYLDLAYRLPIKSVKASINFTLNNVFTITHYSGNDPEVRVTNHVEYQNNIYRQAKYMFLDYPSLRSGLEQQSEWFPSKSFGFGIKLNF